MKLDGPASEAQLLHLAYLAGVKPTVWASITLTASEAAALITKLTPPMGPMGKRGSLVTSAQTIRDRISA